MSRIYYRVPEDAEDIYFVESTAESKSAIVAAAALDYFCREDGWEWWEAGVGVGFEFLPDANPESKPIFKAKARMQWQPEFYMLED